MSGTVLTSVSDGIGLITLNRPEKLNAMPGAMLEALLAAVTRMRDDDAARCVVLTGAGRGFCAGGDLSAVEGEAPPPPTLAGRAARLERLGQAAAILHDMPKPTIAMINGPCAGAGFSLAGACDLRFAAESAFLTSAFVRAGVSGDFGGSYFWTKIVGSGRARELYLLSERVSATVALAQGLVHRVYPDAELTDVTLAAARQIAGGRPEVFAQIKRNIAAAEQETLAAALRSEAVGMIVSAHG